MRLRAVLHFTRQLAASRVDIVTTVRKTRGDDIDAACGQLAGEVQDRTQARQRMAGRRVIDIQAVLSAGVTT